MAKKYKTSGAEKKLGRELDKFAAQDFFDDNSLG